MSDPKPLSPTEDLILGLVTSRYVLGDPFYPVLTRNRRALDSLVARGLVTYETGRTDGVYDVTATPTALALYLSPYMPPALDPRCRSRYIGPKIGFGDARCRHPARHDGDHESQVLDKPVTWTDAQAGGRDDPRYAALIAQAETPTVPLCGEEFPYLRHDTTVACDLPAGHETDTTTADGVRHLWSGDREHRPWMKPVAWTAADAEHARHFYVHAARALGVDPLA